MDELLAIEPPEEERYRLGWDPRVLDLPLFHKNNRNMTTAHATSKYLRELGVRARYIRPSTVHGFRAEGLHLIGMSHVYFELV